MPDRCVKTALGRTEISSRSLALPRTARNLLLMIDGSRPAAQWLDMIAGAGPADLDLLLEKQLIEAVDGPTAGAPWGAASSPDADEAALRAMGRDRLYTLVTRHARARLGLVKGLRLVLEVEKCASEAELRDLARRFVAQVRDAKGDAAVREMLGDAG